jgi:hypothetical protein
VETAVIRIPSRARVIRNGHRNPENIVTASQFKEGDKVQIMLGYNEELLTEFTGFVGRMNQEAPLEVACEGYSWLLRRNRVSFSEQEISLADYLKKAVAGAPGINVTCATSIVLNNIQVNGCGLDALNAITRYTNGTISCFFTAPGKLWCGPLYHATGEGKDVLRNGTATYQKGLNITDKGKLKWRSKNDLKVAVTYSKSQHNGTRLKATSTIYAGAISHEEAVLNHIAGDDALRLLANEKACRLSYTGYEASLQGFLQPGAEPGNIARYTDTDYPEREGSYLIESTEVLFGMAGARRNVELGPRINFLKETI